MNEPVTIACPSCNKKMRVKEKSRLERPIKCPKCEHRFRATVPKPVKETAPKTEEKPISSFSPSEPKSITESSFPDQTESAMQNVGTRRKKKKGASVLILGIAVLLAGTIAVSVFLFRPAALPPATHPVQNKRPHKLQVIQQSASFRSLSIAGYNPTKGKPITLQMLPSGVSILIHIDLSKLDFSAQPGDLLSASMLPFRDWLKERLQLLCHFDVSEIDQVLIGIIPGPEGIMPEFAAVVQLKKDVQKSELMKRLKGKPVDATLGEVIVNDQFAWMLSSQDSSQFAVCPKAYADDLWSFRNSAPLTSEGVRILLKHSDSSRLVTILFQTDDVRRHVTTLFPSSQSVVKSILNWIDNDAETILWSLHSGSELFFSELTTRTRTPVRGKSYQKKFLAKLDQLPEEMIPEVRAFKPVYRGAQRLTGRFPAMLEAVRRSTEATSEKRITTIKTVLPKKAGPNLALAGSLAWIEATRLTGTNSVVTKTTSPPPSKPTSKLPDTVAGRLQFPIDIEFNRTPLQEAFQYIAEELKIKLDIKGEALKLEGYTKNMPQTFTQEKMRPAAAVHKILVQYDQMAIAIDEKTMTLIVLTKASAKENKIKIYSVAPVNEK